MRTIIHLFVCVWTSIASLHAGGVYWSDRGASELYRMQFDGTELGAIRLSGEITEAGSNIRGVALDGEGKQLFWADNGTDRLFRASLNGASSGVLHSITGGRSFPADLLWSESDQRLFWCDRNRGHIQSIAGDGTSPSVLIENAARSGPYFMDLVSAADRVYWGEYAGGSIYRAQLDGSNRETLITGNNEVRGVKVDPSEGYLYWIDRNDAKIYRCPLAALQGTPLAMGNPAIQLLYAGLDTPHGLELDIPARKLYWADTGTNRGSGSGGEAVSRGDFDGSGEQEILARGSQPWDVVLDRRCQSYDEWRRRVFHREMGEDLTRTNADPDGDGLTNAMEYALDSAPLNANQRGTFKSRLIENEGISGTSHQIVVQRRSATIDLEYRIEVSTDLGQWQGAADSSDVIEQSVVSGRDGLETVTASTRYSVNELSEHYIRLNVKLGNAEFTVTEPMPVEN